MLRKSHLAIVGALAACALSLVVASAGVASTKADPVLNVFYAGTSSLSARLDDGTTVRAGSVIAPGSYALLVYDDDYMTPRFTLSGPGVNVVSDLNSTGMGIDAPSSLGPITLQPSSSYRIQDTNIGAGALITFTTSAGSGGGSAGGGSSGGGGSAGGSGGGSTGGTNPSGGGSAGTNTVKTLGTFAATVAATGKHTLLLNGKAPKTLKAGTYKVSFNDKSNKAGLVLVDAKKHIVSLSGTAATGSGSRKVTLAVGRWYYMNPAGGPKTYFTVTK